MTPQENKSLLAYTPMLHARMFAETPKYRDQHFQPLMKSSDAKDDLNVPFLDGHAEVDRPLFVQFCANDPDAFLAAARHVQPYCDAVDLNLGCPQGIARRGHYGAFLQEDQDLIVRMINKLHRELDIPVTAKMRILDTRAQTLAYARRLLDAGASIITVHGRTRDQKGHKTGLADWKVLRWLREQLPKETVIFANGNILQHHDIHTCLEATGVDGVMSAEGNLCDPSIFAPSPQSSDQSREYWQDTEGRGGYRMDAVLRRYMDIIHKDVLCQEPPTRRPLFVPGDEMVQLPAADSEDPPAAKRQKIQHKAAKLDKTSSPNLAAMQPHLFNMLRPLVAKHTDIRDALAKCRTGDMAAYERVLTMVEAAVCRGLLEYAAHPELEKSNSSQISDEDENYDETRNSVRAQERCRRPWFICQPYIRPLPDEALAKGAIQLSKKDLAKMEREREDLQATNSMIKAKVEKRDLGPEAVTERGVEISNEGLVCG